MSTSWIGSRTAIAAPTAAPRRSPEHVRVGERVSKQSLERRAGHRQTAADEHRGQDPWQPQLPDDRLGGRRPGDADIDAKRARQDHPDGLHRADTDRAETDAEDERDEQDAARGQADDERPGADPRGDTPGAEVAWERASRHGR